MASSLTWAGWSWLVNTLSTSDMLQNAVSLTFVFELDDTLFAALVPAKVHTLVALFEPLPRPLLIGEG